MLFYRAYPPDLGIECQRVNGETEETLRRNQSKLLQSAIDSVRRDNSQSPPAVKSRIPLDRRDVWTAVGIFLFSWVLFASIEQSPFKLQGAVLEALVERGHLYFLRGNAKGIVFENLDTNTPSFRYLFNIFPYNGLYHVNHAPGQFLLAAPWYAALVKLGWRFETHEHFVWRIIVWTLTAPLGALGVMCVFILARKWRLMWAGALIASVALGLCSPWWAASGVLYHDSIAVALILIALTIWQCRPQADGIWAILSPFAAGLLLAYSIVTTYLVVPIVLVTCGFLLASRPSAREALLFTLGFLPSVAILPITNMIAFGSPLATGYSAGRFDENYPAPFDFANAWEKVGFYLWNPDYGLLALFPVFLLGAFGLTRLPTVPIKRQLLTLALVHFLFIITIQHHGSVGWGMGRFFLPLYPILVFGLPMICTIEGWTGAAGRALLFATMMYSAVYAAAGTWYGIQGVMEPGVATLKLRLIAEHRELYQGIFVLALIVAVTGELFVQWVRSAQPQAGLGAAKQDSRTIWRDRTSKSAKAARRNPRRK